MRRRQASFAGRSNARPSRQLPPAEERRKNPISPSTVACFHLMRKTAGSSSAPARKVRTMAPVPERNLIQESSAPKPVVPGKPIMAAMAPMTSCATMPRTISERAVATRNHTEISVASSASPSHKAACVHTCVMRLPPCEGARTLRDARSGCSWRFRANLPTRHVVGVISPNEEAVPANSIACGITVRIVPSLNGMAKGINRLFLIRVRWG